MRAVNLIPADQRSGTPVGLGRSGGAAYAVLAIVAGLAVMALLYGLARHQVSSRSSQVAELNAKAQNAQSAATQLAPYTSFVALRQQRAQAVAQLVDSRFDWAHVFHEFGRVLPSDASISSLSGTVGSAGTGSSKVATASASASVSSATPPGSVPTFTISGCATSQQAVADTIDRLRLIDGVTGVALQSSTKSGGGGAAGAGGCVGGAPAYQLTVSFSPLPVPTAAESTITTASAGASGGAR